MRIDGPIMMILSWIALSATPLFALLLDACCVLFLRSRFPVVANLFVCMRYWFFDDVSSVATKSAMLVNTTVHRISDFHSSFRDLLSLSRRYRTI